MHQVVCRTGKDPSTTMNSSSTCIVYGPLPSFAYNGINQLDFVFRVVAKKNRTMLTKCSEAQKEIILSASAEH